MSSEELVENENAATRSGALCVLVRDAFLDVLPTTRIRSLLAYGSMIDGRSNDSDLDLYIVLDTWRADDVDRIRIATRTLPFTTDLALHYADELPFEPAQFRLGTKTCLALTYLASARVLVGENIARPMYEKLTQREVSISALHSITYYLGLLRLKATCEPNQGQLNRLFDKYLARSVIDAMIFHEKSTYEPFKHLTNTAVINLARDHGALRPIVLKQPRLESVSDRMALMQNLHQHVYQNSYELQGGLV